MRGEDLWDIIFPRDIYCNVCGKYIDKSRKYGLCDHCIKHINFQPTVIENELDYSLAAIGYGVYERQLIFNLKYNKRTYMARNISDIMYDAVFKLVSEKKVCPLLGADMIIPVPLHDKRLKERGFNQSEKIALHLSKKLGMQVKGDILFRTRSTEAQRALSKEERTVNMQGAFSVKPSKFSEICGKKIILLDDIYTTGATAKGCAEALMAVPAENRPQKIYYISLLFAGNRNHLMVE